MLRIYYSNTEYEPGKHEILTFYSDRSLGGMPEEVGNTLSDFSVLEVEERYNTIWHELLAETGRRTFLNLPPKFYINNNGEVVDADTDQVVTINPNPQQEEYNLSALYGLTKAQLETYIDNNITDLASAKEFHKKIGAVVLWLVKQSRLDE